MPVPRDAEGEEPGRPLYSSHVTAGSSASAARNPTERPRIPGTVLHPDEIHDRTRHRVEYFEAKQATHYEKKERDAIRTQIGKEIRDKCRAELDDYYDCMCERTFTFVACRSFAAAVQKCIKKYERPEVMDKRWQEIALEREALGLSRINRRQRKYYNKYISDVDGSGWLPRRKTETTGPGDQGA
ncbi:hypothetical protein BESB_052000 [Besnoitia besnoiti]|uniref:COX assembly mitochondrial protein n=1 Tax=Besnoitia besnoiti TaxID=94643 RepID=A0A2A9MCE8_BESBE|nr:hypothetical protein BESB_052000 [Besnoitia besnoiti]PFH35549.1 hypothetical protein BESB_052000 [Besnoitia besnoiti]